MGKKPIDLTLLRIFEAIMAERNVSRAAEHLGLSQSVVSKGLGQLRVLFKDPLFIRRAGGVIPTHKAAELSRGVGHSIRILEKLLGDGPEFDPGSAQIGFTVGVSDYASYVLLPALVRMLVSTAPGVTLHTKEIDNRTAEEMLLAGQVDLCLASDARFAYPIHYSELFQDRYVCVARAGHPVAGKRLSVDEFLSYPHLVMRRQSGGTLGVVEQALSAVNRTRRIAISVSSLLSVPEILACTDMLMTTTERIATRLQRHAALSIHAHPLDLGEFRYAQLWHQRSDGSPSHRWLRQAVVLCTQLPPWSESPRGL